MNFDPRQAPVDGILKSDLLTYQPNRHNIQPLSKHLSQLLARTPSLGGPSRDYLAAVLVPAQFLLGHLLPHLTPQLSLSQLLDSLHHHGTDLLPKSLLKLIAEFSKVYRARLLINKMCASDYACNKLAQWHEATSSKPKDDYNYFDDERERCEEAYKLIESELSRGSSS